MGEVLQLAGVVQRENALDDVVPCQLRRKFRRGVAQNEDLSVGAVFPHGERLLQIGNGKPAHAQLPEFLADRLVAVTVGVRLYHRHILGMLRQHALYGANVVLQCG